MKMAIRTQGRTCKEFFFLGGGVLATWERLYTKTILQRHNATYTDLYFYPHGFCSIFSFLFFCTIPAIQTTV